MSKQIPPTRSAGRGPGLEAAERTRKTVRDLLAKSPAFGRLSAERQDEILTHTARVAAYLIEPDGIRLPLGSEGPLAAAQSASLSAAVNFPDFMAGLIRGVFQAIVNASLEQMEAYGRLVAEVSKSVDQFLEENVSDNEGRDYLAEQFPDVFEPDPDSPAARVRLRAGVDKAAALKRVNATLPVEDWPASDLDDDTIEKKLVPAARRRLASSRQQLLATMILMGINRIVVTDSKKPDK
jgi:hypothetical protein